MYKKAISSQLAHGRSEIRGLTINSQSATRQVISIMDVISEGPIKGLVNNQSSVFFNDERFADEVESVEGGALAVNYTAGSVEIENEPDLYVAQGSFFVFTVRAAETQTVTIQGVNLSANPDPSQYNTPKGVLLRGPNGYTETSKYFKRVSSGERELARLTLNNGRIIKGYLTYAGSGELNQYNEVLFMPLDISITAQREIEIASSGPLMTAPVKLEVDYEIIYRSTTGQLAINWPFESGAYNTQISERAYKTYGGIKTGERGPSAFLSLRNVDSSTLEFRPGTADQDPIEGPGGIGNISITASINEELTKFEENLSPDEFTAEDESPIVRINTTEMDLSLEQVSEVDEVRIAFQYDSLVAINNESGGEHEVGAVYVIKLITYVNGDRSTGEATTALEIPRIHTGKSTVPISFEETFSMNKFRPFQDFEFVIERVKRHSGAKVFPNGDDGKKKNELSANCKISSVTSIIKERFSYPYTAHANVTFSSVDYSDTPTRSYEIYGKLVSVPSNYTTRENNDGVNAVYDGFWDGTFKTLPEYTDNPAWIFYDILTNNNYGLGTWLSADDIDKYSLYRIAKYCDELVPDGAGGLEPRFRANIYLAKQADAYKVLKDMASIFFGMLYWMDGQIVAVNDTPKDPLFTFAKSNVINGAFSYENTGSKTRSNQVIVYWNNPDDSYTAEPLIVEDRENIISTGKIIKEDVSAFGCTSRGQAYRYGVWKLWTAKNQTELVSFSTSIDAAFLAPGDIIKIQDADRFNTVFSGRLKNMASNLELELDRQILLTQGRTYELSITLTDPTAETDQNLSEDEVRPLKVDTKIITATSTGAVSSLIIPSSFSETPPTGAVWVIKEMEGEATVDGSAKDYRILSVSESSKNEYAITAVEHYNEKFDSVYGDLNLYLIENIFPDYTNSSDVYSPENVYVSLESDPAKKGDEFKILWDSPVNLDLTLFTDIAGYEIHHNIPNYVSPIRVGSNINSYSFEGVTDGPYAVAVRSINTSGYRSDFKVCNFDVEDRFRLNVPRKAEGVGIGGIVGAGLFVVDGILQFNGPKGIITNPGIATIVNPTDIILDQINTLDTTTLTNDVYEVLFDKSALSLVPLKHTTIQNLGYWYVKGSEFTTIDGTVSLSARSNKLRGTNTSFITDFRVGDIIKLSSSNLYAKVTNILTNNSLVLDRSFPTEQSGSITRAGFRIDFEEDSLVGKLTKTSETTEFSNYCSIDASLLPSNAVEVTVVSSSGGNIFKNNAGDAKVLTVLAVDSGTGADLVPEITSYTWTINGESLYVNSSNELVPSGTPGAVEATGAFPSIIVGPEDITDGSSELIQVEITL